MKTLVRILGSLHVAVPMLIAIALVLAWGTIYETRFGTASVQRFVYQAWWFQTLLAFLALNLAVAALQRYPWRRKHVPFVLAHIGIILILIGGILGGRFGIEGQLIIPEGQAERMLQLPYNVLIVHQPNPDISQTFRTNFETMAWQQQPHVLFRVPLENRIVNLVVDRYYPDAVMEEQVANDATEENPAVLVMLKHELQEERAWLLARDSERFGLRWGEAHVLFLEPKTPQEWDGLLGRSVHDPASRGVVVIELPTHQITKEIPIPGAFDEPIAIEGTPYVVTFKQYFNDLAITEQGVVDRSDEPNNPAIALTVSGPEGVEPFLAFALHPDFSSMHSRQHAIHAHVTMRHGAASAVPPNSIAILRHANGALSCLMTHQDPQRHLAACEVGRPYVHPWLGYQFELAAYHPRARIETQFRNRSQAVRSEALHLVLQDGAATAQAWLGLRGTSELTLNGHRLILEYRPAQREVPFTIKLLDFRKIDYPGTQMAWGFEADVQLTDPQRGVILMRKISMNNPLKYRGYSFFQSSFIPGDPETTVLSVRNDPGTPLVYTGFLIVILGVVSMFILRAKTASGQAGLA